MHVLTRRRRFPQVFTVASWSSSSWFFVWCCLYSCCFPTVCLKSTISLFDSGISYFGFSACQAPFSISKYWGTNRVVVFLSNYLSRTVLALKTHLPQTTCIEEPTCLFASNRFAVHDTLWRPTTCALLGLHKLRARDLINEKQSHSALSKTE